MHAINLFAASYSSLITTLQLIPSNPGNYSIEAIASSKACTPAPSWLTLDHQRDVLYCSGVTADSTGILHSLSIDVNGSLNALDEISTPGGAAASAIYGKYREALGVAYFGVGTTGGSIETYDIRSPENLTTIQTTTLTISAPGPNPTQSMAHAHEIIPDPSGRFVVVPDLGADLLRVFGISKADELVPVSTVELPKGSGPRHGTFVVTEEGGIFFYILTQISNELIGFKIVYGEGGMEFEEVQRVDALRRLDGSEIFMGPSTQNASELHVSPDSRFLLASLRDDASFQIPSPLSPNTTISSDTLLSYAIDPENGQVKLVDEAPAGGATPRQFSLNKKGDFVAVAVQNNGWVAVLERDVRSGKVGGIIGVVGGLGSGNRTGVVCVIWDE